MGPAFLRQIFSLAFEHHRMPFAVIGYRAFWKGHPSYRIVSQLETWGQTEESQKCLDNGRIQRCHAILMTAAIGLAAIKDQGGENLYLWSDRLFRYKNFLVNTNDIREIVAHCLSRWTKGGRSDWAAAGKKSPWQLVSDTSPLDKRQYHEYTAMKPTTLSPCHCLYASFTATNYVVTRGFSHCFWSAWMPSCGSPSFIFLISIIFALALLLVMYHQKHPNQLSVYRPWLRFLPGWSPLLPCIRLGQWLSLQIFSMDLKSSRLLIKMALPFYYLEFQYVSYCQTTTCCHSLLNCLRWIPILIFILSESIMLLLLVRIFSFSSPLNIVVFLWFPCSFISCVGDTAASNWGGAAWLLRPIGSWIAI